MPHRCTTKTPDLVIDVDPALRHHRATTALGLSVLPEAAGYRQAIEEGRLDPHRAAVEYLEALVAEALKAPIGEVAGEAAGRVLLAEELLLILTGSSDLEAVRAWLRRHGAEERRGAVVG